MESTFFTSLAEAKPILIAGIIIIVLFIVLRFFRAIFSLSFIGFLASLYSYFATDYYFAKIPIIAAVGFVLCACGFSKDSIICKLFSLCGVILSGYIIIHSLGFI